MDFLKNIIPAPLSKRRLDKIFSHLEKRYHRGEDPWGLDLANLRTSLKYGYPIYHNYFRVNVFNAERVLDHPYVLVSNHSGQIPFDAMLLSSAFLIDVYPPRVLRAMVERFAVALPFLSRYFLGNGAVLGDRQNCLHLLERGETVLVFPEGVKGISKSTPDYYHMKPFSRGFFRLALQAGVDVLPVAVVGAEEFYPLVYQAHKIAKTLGLPAAPISPLFPFAGLLGVIPLPSPVDIYIGDPYPIPKDISPEAPDHIIDAHVQEIQSKVDQMLQFGVRNRRPFWGAQIATDVMSYIKDKGKP